MQLMVCLALALLAGAGAALAHFGGDYESRNLVEREEPDNYVDGSEIVECPVCKNAGGSLLLNSNEDEECTLRRGEKSYKRCKYGAYNNKACGNRRDCYRGPKDRCTEKMANDLYDQRCAPGYYCNPTMGVCTGSDYAVDSIMQWLLSPNHHRYPISEQRLPARANNLGYPIRARRLVQK